MLYCRHWNGNEIHEKPHSIHRTLERETSMTTLNFNPQILCTDLGMMLANLGIGMVPLGIDGNGIMRYVNQAIPLREQEEKLSAAPSAFETPSRQGPDRLSIFDEARDIINCLVETEPKRDTDQPDEFMTSHERLARPPNSKPSPGEYYIAAGGVLTEAIDLVWRQGGDTDTAARRFSKAATILGRELAQAFTVPNTELMVASALIAERGAAMLVNFAPGGLARREYETFHANNLYGLAADLWHSAVDSIGGSNAARNLGMDELHMINRGILAARKSINNGDARISLYEHSRHWHEQQEMYEGAAADSFRLAYLYAHYMGRGGNIARLRDTLGMALKFWQLGGRGLGRENRLKIRGILRSLPRSDA